MADQAPRSGLRTPKAGFGRRAAATNTWTSSATPSAQPKRSAAITVAKAGVGTLAVLGTMAAFSNYNCKRVPDVELAAQQKGRPLTAEERALFLANFDPNRDPSKCANRGRSSSGSRTSDSLC